MKIQANKKRFHFPDLAWLLTGSAMTLLAFLCSTFAVLISEWFHIYCLEDPSIGAQISYRFGLWDFCGDDLNWVVNDTSIAGTDGDSLWSCLSIDNIVPTHPAWLQGTRWFEVSGCSACGSILVVMLVHLCMPIHYAKSSSTGFTVANLTAAIFFTGSLLTVFAVQNRPLTIVPSDICNLTAMPSSYAVTLTTVAIGSCLLSAAITGIVSEGFVGTPVKGGNGRVVRQIDN